MKRAVIGAVVAGCLLAGFGISQWSSAQHQSWVMHASQTELEQYVPGHPTDILAKVRLGQINIANKDSRGIEILKAAADASPGEEAVWFAYADAIEDPNEAMALLETYLKVLPESTKLQAAKARRLAELGDPSASLNVTDELLKRVGNDIDVLRARADALMLLRRVNEASDALQLAIKQSDRTDLRLLLAMTLVPQQRYKELREVCLPMTQAKDDEVPSGHLVRARMYLAGAALNLATPIDEIRKTATDLDGILDDTAMLEAQEQFLPHYFLGECYLRLGRTEDASRALYKAVSMAPHFPAALYSLARSVQASKDSGVSSMLFKRHAHLTSLLSQIDSLSTRAQERSDDAALTKQLSAAQESLNKLLEQPLPTLSGN